MTPPRKVFTPPPMHESLTRVISQAHVAPLLRPAGHGVQFVHPEYRPFTELDPHTPRMVRRAVRAIAATVEENDLASAEWEAGLIEDVHATMPAPPEKSGPKPRKLHPSQLPHDHPESIVWRAKLSEGQRLALSDETVRAARIVSAGKAARANQAAAALRPKRPIPAGPHPCMLPADHPRHLAWRAKLREGQVRAGQDPDTKAARSAAQKRRAEREGRSPAAEKGLATKQINAATRRSAEIGHAISQRQRSA